MRTARITPERPALGQFPQEHGVFVAVLGRLVRALRCARWNAFRLAMDARRIARRKADATAPHLGRPPPLLYGNVLCRSTRKYNRIPSGLDPQPMANPSIGSSRYRLGVSSLLRSSNAVCHTHRTSNFFPPETWNCSGKRIANDNSNYLTGVRFLFCCQCL